MLRSIPMFAGRTEEQIHNTTLFMFSRRYDKVAVIAREGELCGTRRGIVDAAIMPFVRQFAAVDRDWFDAQPLGHLQRWLARHLDSSLFATVMLRKQPWAPGDARVVFPPDAA